mmetsp:Transcript_34407/g.52688  ORF Transcript_34407/g.52688 Transcript_34407/m.52688 type:complete len:199 (-) Transcript_34407:42-638(-)
MQDIISAMKDNEYGLDFDFFIARIYRSLGKVDNIGISNYMTAISAGIQNVHVYIFPDTKRDDPSKQMMDAMNALTIASGGLIPQGTHVWLDIETLQWSSNKEDNQNFIKGLMSYMPAIPQGVTLGIYSSHYNWDQIVGLDWTYPADQGLPLWYAHYDNTPNFEDFKAFGGWETPLIKQFSGTSTVAGLAVDLNVSETF